MKFLDSIFNKNILSKIVKLISRFAFVFKQMFLAGKAVFFLYILCIFIDGLLSLTVMYALNSILKIVEISINGAASERMLLKVLFPLALVLVCQTLIFSSSSSGSSINRIMGLSLSFRMNTIVIEKFKKVRYEFFSSPDFLDSFKNAREMSSYAPMNVVSSLFSLISCFIQIVSVSIVLVSFNYLFLLLIVLFFLPMFVFNLRMENLVYNFTRKRTIKSRKISYYTDIMTSLEFAAEMRTMNLFKYFSNLRSSNFRDFLKENKVLAKKEIKIAMITSFVAAFGVVLAEFFLIKQTLHGVKWSSFVFYNSAIATLYGAFLRMIFASVNNYNSMLFLDYLFDFLNWKEEKTSDNLKVDTTKKYVVKLVNVSFVYPNCQKYALKNINLKFESNKLVCIVGENGSGKSTLMKLILGIYEPTSGKVLLNDKNLKDYDEAERNRLFGTAFQEVNSYYVSVDDYINFGDIDNVKDTKPYANMSLANAFIEKFQNKYQTLLSKQFDENGVVPSGGQLQKLSLARAFCSKAPIMLFDEPTAALDPLSENHICEILKILGKSYTVILISHKMCHCKLADHVVVLKDGEIIEAGNHADLLKFKNIYYEMYKVQAKNFEN